MEIILREFNKNDINAMNEIWNNIVSDGIAFPQTEMLDDKSGYEFFKSQTFTSVAVNTQNNEIVGLYILHPNNVGRCSHICNASYAVKNNLRGNHIGEKRVKCSIKRGKEKGFKNFKHIA